ncbi:anti-sigma factor domain-containing protein [Peribacillus frigoritolerans]|uniref:Anti-sigma factor domain-containing protein n=1 Tax=Peribacillus castrilensis TaxID=2897690 RepID=A0AAW9NG02_9BACI|nr:anti-sigma factor domain-containing protein [Peribacillus castrilensis]MEC0299780.1 anti-sigma factor domain-containing protein [Peribacillus castrilensis]MEC0343589.1 anti-sigma factor domain-containing protein [Peribacillus castrilensis]
MKKGVILSVNKRFVTLLTPEGEFLKTKRQEREYEVGEEITFSPAKQKFTLAFSNIHSSFKKTAVLSIASTFLILFSILPSYFSGPVSAYMTIDVNPSIELELDDDLEVLKLTGLNEDGKLVIGQLKDWKGKDIKAVTNRIVETTKQLGYLKGNKQIVVSTTLMEKNKELDKNLKEEIKEISEQDNVSKTKMKVIQATKSDRKQAREQGISTGKYLEKKLNEDKDKIKVNRREPAPAPVKKVEENVVIPKEKGVMLSTENKSDGEKKENNEIEIKQKPANEAKPTERKNEGTEVTEIKEQTEREDTSGKRNAINGYKEKSNESKGKSDRYHSNQSKDKQKNEQNDKKFDEKKVSSLKEKNSDDSIKPGNKNKQNKQGRHDRQDKQDTQDRQEKQVKQVKQVKQGKQGEQYKQNRKDWDKSKRGKGNNGNGHNH